MRAFVFLTALFVAPMTATLQAESAPLRLRNPDQVQSYRRVSNRLNCLCGCHGLVSQCAHVQETCFAVQARIFIETRILEGMTADQIVLGFTEGFGERVTKDAQMQELLRNGQDGVVRGFVSGFGPSILFEPPPVWPRVALFTVALLLLLVLVARLVRGPSQRNGPPTGNGETNAGSPRSDEPPTGDPLLEKALGRLHDLQR